MSGHPTNKNRNQRQKLKAHEDAQLYGLIPTTPEEAVRDERVDPATQGEQALPALDRKAIRKGWATPDEKKPKVVDRLMAIVENPESENYEVIASARALMAGDPRQWEWDNADLANMVNGGSQTNVNVTLEQVTEFIRIVEAKIGRKILPPALQQIEEDASRVLPDELAADR